MSNRVHAALTVVGLCAVLVGGAAWAQTAAKPAAMDAVGCCCVEKGIAFDCSDQTQAACLKQQPQAPAFQKMADWHAAWNKFMAAQRAAESRPMVGGWIAESCGAAINPKTGEPKGAPTGCCCFPPKDKPVCKATMTEFDCMAECAELRDGRAPNPCAWNAGACK